MKPLKNKSRKHLPKKKVEKQFYSEYPYNQPNSDLYVDEDMYKKVIVTFFENLIPHLIETGDHYKIPGNMGRMYIKKFRASRTMLNYQAWKQGKFQYYTNYHTFGYSVKLKWDKERARIRNMKMYKFTPVRKVSRKISKENQINNHVYKYTE